MNQQSTTRAQRAGGKAAFTPLAAALVMAWSPGPAAALDYVWFGGSGDFESPANWSLVGIPGPSDRAIINGGIATLGAARGVLDFRLTGGGLAGTGNLSVSGLVEFTDGQIGGFGGQVIANGGLAISGNASKTLGASNGTTSSGIVNNAAATWSGNGNLSNWATGRFTNSATGSLDIQTDANFSGGTFINQGSIIKSVGAGGTARNVFSSALDNTGSVSVLQGTLEVTSAFDNRGVIGTAAGAIFHGNNAAFSNRGRIEGNGVVRTATNAGLLNQGVIAPGFSTGTLTIDGDVSFAALGVAQFELTGLVDFDRLLITDDVRFDGTLDVLNLGYTPVVGDSFKIITFDQRLADSQFASLTWSGFGPGVVFTATYNANDVTLNVSAVPEPGTWLLMLAGIGVIGQLTRRLRPTSSRGSQLV